MASPDWCYPLPPYQPNGASYGALLAPPPVGGYSPPVPAPPYGGLPPLPSLGGYGPSVLASPYEGLPPPPPVPVSWDPTLLAAQHSASSRSSSVGGGDWYMDSATLTAFYSYVTTQFGRLILALQTDNGKEFDNVALRTLLASHGTTFRLTCPYTSQQNGRAERILRTLNDCVPPASAPSAPAPAPPSCSDARRQPPAAPPARRPLPPPPGFVTPSPEVESERAPSYEVEPGTPPAHPATGSTSPPPVASSAAAAPGAPAAASAAAPAAASGALSPPRHSSALLHRHLA
nr:mucin-7-like [Aegilops tauschii subsp. strangulata]